jgi:hypothetical protein
MLSFKLLVEVFALGAVKVVEVAASLFVASANLVAVEVATGFSVTAAVGVVAALVSTTGALFISALVDAAAAAAAATDFSELVLLVLEISALAAGAGTLVLARGIGPNLIF